MRTAIALLLQLVLTAPAVCQYTSASFTGFTYGASVSFHNPVTNSVETRFAGLFHGRLTDTATGPQVSYYFLDVKRPSSFNMPRNDYIDDVISEAYDLKICYIINNFYPGQTGTGQLQNLNSEAAAIQFAIWSFSSELQLSSIGNSEIRERAQEIALLTNNNSNGQGVRLTVEFIMDEEPEYFSLKTVDDNGDPIAVDSIVLSFDQGLLNQYLVSSSLPTGITERVEVIGANTGYIDAFSRKFVFPKASLFRHNSNVFPRVLLAKPGYGARSFVYDWGTLPVELISLTAEALEGTVKIKWITGQELNNSHFDIERKREQSEWIKAGTVSGSGNASSPKEYEFTDLNVAAGTYSYRLKQIDYNGNFEYHLLNDEVVVSSPDSYALFQNHPNPFNPSTVIRYSLRSDGIVRLTLYDANGREVAELLNSYQNAGSFELKLNTSEFNLSSGIYFCRMEVPGFTKVIRMMLIK